MRNDMEEAEQVVRWFKSVFGDDYYLELQLHPSGDPRKDADVYENQLLVNKALLELSAKCGVKYICSNDVHFILAEDAVAHDHLICLNTGRDLDDPNRMRYTFQEYLKSPEEMARLFPDHPEALATTLEIADKVEEYKLTHAPLMPNFLRRRSSTCLSRSCANRSSRRSKIRKSWRESMPATASKNSMPGRRRARSAAKS